MAYLTHLAILFAIYAILGISLDLVVGYTGLLSVAHAAFYGIGAYTTAILLMHFHINFFIAVIAAMIIAGIVAILVGLVLSRFRGDYYALASLGFNVIVFSILLNWQSLTRGPLGIPGIPRPSLAGFSISSSAHFLLLALSLLLIVFFICRFIERSSFGRALQAIREDEKALEVFGYRTTHYKLAVFAMSASLASIAGALFASYITFIDPSTFTINESIFIIALIIVGGIGNIRASIVGAAIMIALPELMRFIGFPTTIAAQMRQVVYGLILVGLMLYRPQGIMGKYKL